MLSRLSPAGTPSDVGAIVRTARRNNAREGITGLLIFDGEHFVHCIEGNDEPVRALLSRVLADPRHLDPCELMRDNAAPHRLFRHWTMGYAYEDCLPALRPLRGIDALNTFLEIASRSDLGS